MAKIKIGRRGVIISRAMESLKLGSDQNFRDMVKLMKETHDVDITQDVTTVLNQVIHEKIDQLDELDLAERIISIHFSNDYGKLVCKCELELFKTKCSQSRTYAVGEIE